VISVAAAINGAIAILTISLFAWLSDLPLVFPALGPTAFILFTTPFSRAAAPRSVILGHLTAIASGYTVWRVISHIDGGAVSLELGGWPMFLSGSLALAVTCLLLVRFSLPHPPACASALVVALGGVTHWSGLLIMGAAVILVTAQAVAINRICCLSVPAWRPRDHDAPA
jgi:CBS-domain-containing membrane protein